jgi:hypothetical protein
MGRPRPDWLSRHTARSSTGGGRSTIDVLLTRQYATGDRELGERIGVLEFRFRLEASQESLVFRQVEAAVVFRSLRVRIPAPWAPRVEAREDPAGARRIGIRVRVVVPVLGPLLTYEGIIDVEEQRD